MSLESILSKDNSIEIFKLCKLPIFSSRLPSAAEVRHAGPKLVNGLKFSCRWYDVTIMVVRTQITLETELQSRARKRAGQVGISLAEYIRRLVARDLACPETKPDVSSIFDLGASGGSNIAVNKDSMIADAIDSLRE
jgi:hypothetical protein